MMAKEYGEKADKTKMKAYLKSYPKKAERMISDAGLVSLSPLWPQHQV